MEYSLVDQGDIKKVIFYGNIKPSTRTKFLEIADSMETAVQKSWVLDVGDFDHIDSAGLGMLIELREKAHAKGISLSIKGANTLVRKMFDLSKFDELFEIID